MTTNHPAHGPVSLNRLHQIREILSKAATQSDGGNLGYAMADAVKVIDGVISAFGAEPVAYMCKDGDDIEYNGHNEFSGGGKGVPLYTTPPAPVVPDERASFNTWNNDTDCPLAGLTVKQAAWMAWLKRSGTIKSFGNDEEIEPVSNSDELPLDYLQGHKDGLEWAAQLAEANHPQTGDWLYDDPIELARAIRKGPDMPTSQAGNSPVTPDGLLGCGENCWSCGKYFTYEQHSECDGYCPHCNSPVDLDDKEDQPSKVVPTNPTEEMISNAWREAIGKCDHETIKRIYATMLAAAPQREG